LPFNAPIPEKLDDLKTYKRRDTHRPIHLPSIQVIERLGSYKGKKTDIRKKERKTIDKT